MTLAWPGEDEKPLAAISWSGQGEDTRAKLSYGTCAAWSFPFGKADERGRRSEIHVSDDCTAFFKLNGWDQLRVRSGLRKKSIPVDLLGPFVDLSTGRHTLRCRVFPVASEKASRRDDTEGADDYKVTGSNFPSPTQLARIIAGLEPAREPTIYFR